VKDPDGVSAAKKFILDGLVAAGAVGISQQQTWEILTKIYENSQREDPYIFVNFTPELYTVWNFRKSTNEVGTEMAQLPDSGRDCGRGWN
jgi:hypothetical protein